MSHTQNQVQIQVKSRIRIQVKSRIRILSKWSGSANIGTGTYSVKYFI
jgi:hypothetical protein